MQTDGQTELRWLRRTAAVAAVAHKKSKVGESRSYLDGCIMLLTLVCLIFYLFPIYSIL